MTMIKKMLLLISGVLLIGMGAAVSIINDCGSDPITLFAQGLSIKLKDYGFDFFSVGNTLVIINLVIFVVLIVIYKLRYIHIGTLIGMVFEGLFVDMWYKLLYNIVLTDNVILKVMWMFIGVILLAIGIGMYISCGMGAVPVDLVSVVISEHFGISYYKTRVVCDLVFVFLGWCLGGVLGVATVICMCLIGPMSGLVIKILKQP